ncbi:hypothetical protein NMG60_11032344 [Bertholletia excelsa]
MPLSEFYRMARGKLEAARQKTAACSTDLSHVPNDEFVELVWENGQIMMQGQSNKAKRCPNSNNFQFQTPKLREKDQGNTANSKIGKFGVMESVLDDFENAVPSGEILLGQEDEMDPWFNSTVIDPLQHDYSDLSGVSVNELSGQNSFSSIVNRNSCSQTIRGSPGGSVHNGSSLDRANVSKVSSSEVSESSRSRTSQLYPWPFQESQTSIRSLRTGVLGTESIRPSVWEDSFQVEASPGGSPVIEIQKQDSRLPHTNSGVMNFSHFSRPVALVRANLQNVGDKNKVAPPCSSNLAEPTCVDLSSGVRKDISVSQPNLVLPKEDSKPLVAEHVEKSNTAEKSESVCQEDVVKNDKLPNQSANTLKGMPDGEKNIEPVVGCSSVCSGNSAEMASNDPMHNTKRKCRETDESEGRSEDVEEESVGVKKATPTRGGSSSKRSRAAEVHNLSERRRRDRINEKMRALQELIPNCNKTDKASMLDEAIEYLKTLQLQVQIMSMGAGLYMPPMMLPTGMQHLHAAHMAHFPSMRIGMGAGMGGMGFGMGVMDMNGGSPMMPGPNMQGPHFSGPHHRPILGPTNYQGMVGPNLPVFGHPSHGIPISAPHVPLVPLSGGPPVNSSNGISSPLEVPSTAPPSNSKDSLQNTDLQTVHNIDVSSSMNLKSTQCGAMTEALEQSSPQKNDQAPDIGRIETPT